MTTKGFTNELGATSHKGTVVAVLLVVGLALVLGVLVPSVASAMEPSGVTFASTGGTGAAVSNLSVYATSLSQDARVIQAVAVLLVVMAGAVALVGAFVLRRRGLRDEL